MPDPRGWLVFTELPNDVQNAEDSTQAADRDRRLCHTYGTAAVWGTDDPAELTRLRRLGDDVMRGAGMTLWSTFARPATATERTLLDHLARSTMPALLDKYTEGELPVDLLTVIHYASNGIRQRRWPQLETT